MATIKWMGYYLIIPANKNASKAYIYKSGQRIENFSVVEIEFGFQKALGICIGEAHELAKAKEILRVHEIILKKELYEFAVAAAEYNLVNLGAILELIIIKSAIKDGVPLIYEKNGHPVGLEELLKKGSTAKTILKNKVYEGIFRPDEFITLTPDQKISAEKIAKLGAREKILLEGATGSGKTIVALEGIADKKKILIITPEIALAKSWAKTISKRFGIVPFFYHHKMPELYKRSVWHWANSEQSGIVIGARSALFLPFLNLEAIIIDEEHSVSLKQEEYPRYHARDMAVLKAWHENIPCIMISATPSLESLYNVEIGKYFDTKLERTPLMGTPEFKVIKQEKNMILAPKIVEIMQKSFENKEQVFLFLNRRGYSPFNLCSLCWEAIKCKACDFNLVLHQNSMLCCHKCGRSEFIPINCPVCKNITTWKQFGIGIERLEEEAKMLFPGQKWQTISSQTQEIEEYIEDINEKKIDGIIATQVLAAGHDFKSIGLVVIVDADMGLNSCDFRVKEKMLQLWSQIRGRSGRHAIKGKIIIQTKNPENEIIKLFQASEPVKILQNERKKGNWPPYSRCASIIIKAKNKQKAHEYLEKHPLEKMENVEGPLYIGKFNYTYIWKFLVKISKKYKASDVVKAILEKMEKSKGVKVETEIDPYNFV